MREVRVIGERPRVRRDAQALRVAQPAEPVAAPLADDELGHRAAMAPAVHGANLDPVAHERTIQPSADDKASLRCETSGRERPPRRRTDRLSPSATRRIYEHFTHSRRIVLRGPKTPRFARSGQHSPLAQRPACGAATERKSGRVLGAAPLGKGGGAASLSGLESTWPTPITVVAPASLGGGPGSLKIRASELNRGTPGHRLQHAAPGLRPRARGTDGFRRADEAATNPFRRFIGLRTRPRACDVEPARSRCRGRSASVPPGRPRVRSPPTAWTR